MQIGVWSIYGIFTLLYIIKWLPQNHTNMWSVVDQPLITSEINAKLWIWKYILYILWLIFNRTKGEFFSYDNIFMEKTVYTFSGELSNHQKGNIVKHFYA